MSEQDTDLVQKLQLLENENERLNNVVMKVQQWINTKSNDGKLLYERMTVKYYEMMTKHNKLEEQLKRTSAEKSRLKFVAQYLADKVEESAGWSHDYLNDSDKENINFQNEKVDFSGSLEDCIIATNKLCSLKSRAKELETELANAQSQLVKSYDTEKCIRKYIENLKEFNLTERKRRSQVDVDLRNTMDRLSTELQLIDFEIIDQQEKVDKVKSDIQKVMDVAKTDTASNLKCWNKLQVEKERLQIELERAAAMMEELRTKEATLKGKFKENLLNDDRSPTVSVISLSSFETAKLIL